MGKTLCDVLRPGSKRLICDSENLHWYIIFCVSCSLVVEYISSIKDGRTSMAQQTGSDDDAAAVPREICQSTDGGH